MRGKWHGQMFEKDAFYQGRCIRPRGQYPGHISTSDFPGANVWGGECLEWGANVLTSKKSHPTVRQSWSSCMQGRNTHSIRSLDICSVWRVWSNCMWNNNYRREHSLQWLTCICYRVDLMAILKTAVITHDQVNTFFRRLLHVLWSG